MPLRGATSDAHGEVSRPGQTEGVPGVALRLASMGHRFDLLRHRERNGASASVMPLRGATPAEP